MYVPRLNPPLRVPRYLRSLAMLSIGIAVALLLWATLSFSTAGNDGSEMAVAFPSAESVRTMAFISGKSAEDQLVLVELDGQRSTTIASFESRAGSLSRGLASPLADTVAVLHPAQHSGFRLTFVDIASGARVTSPALLGESSPLVWAPDASTFLTAIALDADGTGRTSVSILAVDPATGSTTTVNTFEGVFQAVPLGYDPARGRVTVAVVNPAGSSIWAVEDGEVTQVSTISAGRTRDWSLSPDGRYVAFVETRNGATVPSVGRVAEVATGTIVSEIEPGSAQEGVAWSPKSEAPAFGGPGSTLNLPGSVNGAYLVPSSWAPLGDALVVRVVTPGEGETSTASWELLFQQGGGGEGNEMNALHGEMSAAASTSAGERIPLFPQAGSASFAGWVQATGTGEAE